ncbi:MAG: glucosamine-6-phosphate deaminase [Spirochaetes bacterium]|nr:glucosamine-6-phosphate deaminase [Spirochaetota bacterium]
MKNSNYNTESNVEKIFLEKSAYSFFYPKVEKIKSIIVDNFPLLGKLTALRFIEWVQRNPGGVISLPTGKTPEHFIKWTQYYLHNWNKPLVKKELEGYGIDTGIFPDMKSLHFVQIDEFYPISPQQENSFHFYILKFYMKGFGLDKKKALLIDTSDLGIPEGYRIEDIFQDYMVDITLRVRQAKDHLESLQKKTIHAVDQFCVDYEEKIRSLGGIGFFLGGIGPDGHIGFNVSGSDFFSTTRLTPINYETAAAAASDLGGVEVSRKRLVITIGLSTIIHRPDVVPIIIAAGESKAGIVADSIQSEKNITYPASILQDRGSARFYLTNGAASRLNERCFIRLKNKKEIETEDIKRHLIDYALNHKTILDDVTESGLKKDRLNKEILKKTGKRFGSLKEMVKQELILNIQRGIHIPTNAVILHTSPHHDDEMLGYLPQIIRLVREKSITHYFTYLTSGFTSVTNSYMLKLFQNLKYFIKLPHFKVLHKDNYFISDYPNARNDDVYYFLDGLASRNEYVKNDALARRLLRIIVEVLKKYKIEELSRIIDDMIHYFESQYPGKKDPEPVQKIKGMIREYEAELVWGYFGFQTSSVIHLRLPFYTGDIFTPQPRKDKDVQPVLQLLKKTKPTIITVALDPEGSGPDTHYKVLQTIAEALKQYTKESKVNNIKIWGYRNVWFRFHPSEANIYVPTTLNALSILNNSFLNCFGSQKDASFPSFEYDGPFSELAQSIYVKQYKMIKNLLGEDYFYKNPHPLLRATRAFVFLKELSLEEFYHHSMALKTLTELA